MLGCATAQCAEVVVDSANFFFFFFFFYDAMHTNHELEATLTGRVAEDVWRQVRRVVAEGQRAGGEQRGAAGASRRHVVVPGQAGRGPSHHHPRGPPDARKRARRPPRPDAPSMPARRSVGGAR